MLNRNITNIIRFFLDECIPPIIRDNKFFVYPLFWIEYRGKNIKKILGFKKNVHNLTDDELIKTYKTLESLVDKRAIDMNRGSIKLCLKEIDDKPQTILDIGCGRGHWLRQLQKNRPNALLTGIDIVHHKQADGIDFIKAKAEALPFPDKSFDIVFSSHVIEHIREPKKMADELKRVAKNKVIIVTPRQRPYKYTFDTHINFFPLDYELPELIGIKNYELYDIGGDWAYIGHMNS